LRDFAGLRDFPEPVAELASGRIWLRSEIEAYLQARHRTKKLRRMA
jgi:predicted DNA-binding transcriptional regulator AlpA